MRQDTLRGVITLLCILVGRMMFVVQVGAQGEQLYVRSELANVRMSPASATIPAAAAATSDLDQV